jgi:hypothetical protein
VSALSPRKCFYSTETVPRSKISFDGFKALDERDDAKIEKWTKFWNLFSKAAFYVEVLK